MIDFIPSVVPGSTAGNHHAIDGEGFEQALTDAVAEHPAASRGADPAGATLGAMLGTTGGTDPRVSGLRARFGGDPPAQESPEVAEQPAENGGSAVHPEDGGADGATGSTERKLPVHQRIRPARGGLSALATPAAGAGQIPPAPPGPDRSLTGPVTDPDATTPTEAAPVPVPSPGELPPPDGPTDAGDLVHPTDGSPAAEAEPAVPSPVTRGRPAVGDLASPEAAKSAISDSRTEVGEQRASTAVPADTPDETASRPPHPSASTPAGPTSVGPTSVGPTSAGPTSAGPTPAGPTSVGPTSAGPTPAGPTSAGPTPAGPTSAGPTSAGPTSAGSEAEPQPDLPAGRVTDVTQRPAPQPETVEPSAQLVTDPSVDGPDPHMHEPREPSHIVDPALRGRAERLASRIEQWAARVEQRPPPHVLTLRTGESHDALTIRVALEAGALRISVDGAGSDDLTWLRAATDQLQARGFDISGYGDGSRRQAHPDAWDQDETAGWQGSRPRMATRPARDGLRL